MKKKAPRKDRRKAARQGAPALEQHLSAVVAHAPVVLFALDPAGRFTLSAGQGLAALGLQPGEVVGRDAREVYRDVPAVVENVERALAGHAFCAVVPVGRLWLEVHFLPHFDLVGRLQGVVGLSLDVTERKRVEDELARTERRFRELIDMMQEGFYVTDERGNRLFANKALARIYGVADEKALLGKSFLDIIEPELRERIRAQFQEAMRTGVFPQRLEVPVVRADGSRGHLEINPSPVYEAGRLAGACGVVRDISARKLTEERLSESEERFRLAFESAGVGMALLAPDGRWLRANQAACRMLGYSESELKAMTFQELTHPEDLPLNLIEARRLLAGEISSMQAEKRYRRKDGSCLWARLNTSLVRSAQGQALYYVSQIEDITERKLSQGKLQEVASKYQSLVETTDTGYVIVDPKGLVVDANPEYVRMTGRRSLDEVRGRSVMDWTAPHDRERNARAVAECMASGRVRSLEMDYAGPDGRAASIEINATVIEMAGAPHIVALCRDVTARKQSERELRRLTFALEHTADAVLCAGEDGRVRYANAAASRLLGWSIPELLRLRLQDIEADIPPEAWPAAWSRLRRQRSLTQETSVRAQDGRLLPVEITADFVSFEGEDLSFSFLRDITRRKRVERDLNVMHFALERARDAVYWIGSDARLRYANEALCRQLGYTREELLAMTVHDIEPGFRPALWVQHWREFQRAGTRSHETKHKAKDGRLIPVEVTASYMEFEGEQFGFVFARDITERKHADDERARLLDYEQSARAAAESASRAKDEFLALVSHELRTPMTAILGWNWLLRSGELSDIERDRALSVIERNMQLQKQIIEDLLDISSLVRRQLTIRKRRVELGGVLADVAGAIREHAQTKAISVDCRVEPELMVEGDPERLRQIFWNLVSNAVKFTPDGSRVAVSLRRDKAQAVAVVEDSGGGVEPDFFPHLFELFRQQEDSLTREHRGLGLGLAIVKHLVDLHGGSVWAEPPTPGRGAKFFVALPLAAAAASSPAATGEDAVSPAAPVPHFPELLRGIQVLIVEDDPDTRAMLATVLTHCGAELRAAASAAEGFASFTSQAPDVVISDISMPDEDGYSFIRRIRALPPERGGQVAAAALTAYATSEDRTKALQAGFQIYLPKPVDPAELVTVVRTLAHKSSGRA